jgi:hypothetical protein
MRLAYFIPREKEEEDETKRGSKEPREKERAGDRQKLNERECI